MFLVATYRSDRTPIIANFEWQDVADQTQNVSATNV